MTVTKRILSALAKFEAHIDYSDLGSVRAFLCIACLAWGGWVIKPGIILNTATWKLLMDVIGDETLVALFPLSAGLLSMVSEVWELKQLKAVASVAVFAWWLFVLTSVLIGSINSTAVPIYLVVAIYSGWVVYRDSSGLWLKRPS